MQTGPVVKVLQGHIDHVTDVALTAVEPDTARFLAAHPSLARALVEGDRRVFAAYASSLLVRGGSVVVPGGRLCDPMWQRIVGKSPQQAEALIRRVFTEDYGRLAYFYAAMDALPESTARLFFRADRLPSSRPILLGLRNPVESLVLASAHQRFWTLGRRPVVFCWLLTGRGRQGIRSNLARAR